MGLVAIQSPLLLFYSSFCCPLKLPLLAARVPNPFISMPKENLAKKKFSFVLSKV